MTLYEILETGQDASPAEIKSAYRRLVKKYHPDINPSMDSEARIREINRAFEVLADPYTRSAYDRSLDRGASFYREEKELSAEEKYKQAFRQKKAREDRERIEYMIRIRARFYRYLRGASFFFFLVGLIFSVDYYYLHQGPAGQFDSISPDHFSTVFQVDGIEGQTSQELFYYYQRLSNPVVFIYRSSVFGYPAKVGISDGKTIREFNIHRTLHSFNNVFSIIILVTSLIVIAGKEYTDFRVTIGLVPFFLVLFLLLYVLQGGAG